MPTLLQQLQKARRLQKLSQQQVSRQLKMPQSYLSKIESGRVETSLANIVQLAHVVGLEVMLVPRRYVPAVSALIQGKDMSGPAWEPDEDKSEGAT